MNAGMRFGKLLVLGPTGGSKSGMKTWFCRCDCGIEVTVIGNNLKKGNSTSCGCVRRAKSAERMKTLNFKHGATNSELFGIWSGIVDRTNCPSNDAFQRYGGRGITIHESWRDFEVFRRYVGERPSKLHTIERIDNDKGYEPGNVKWATMAEQARNRRTNRWVLIGGVRMILADAAKAKGVSKSTVSRWLRHGLLEAAV